MYRIKCLTVVLLFLSIFRGECSFCQQHQDLKGFSIYKKYDQSFITPDLKGKHSVSLGPAFTSYTPNVVDIIVSPGFQMGYHYLVLKRRKLKSSRKGKFREEVKLDFGLNVSIYTESQFAVTATFFRPLIRTYGRLLSWSFLSEYGLGALRGTQPLDQANKVRFNLNIELFRLRIGRMPLYLHTNFDYDLQNDFLSNERINLGLSAGLRYYIYKKKI